MDLRKKFSQRVRGWMPILYASDEKKITTNRKITIVAIAFFLLAVIAWQVSPFIRPAPPPALATTYATVEFNGRLRIFEDGEIVATFNDGWYDHIDFANLDDDSNMELIGIRDLVIDIYAHSGNGWALQESHTLEDLSGTSQHRDYEFLVRDDRLLVKSQEWVAFYQYHEGSLSLNASFLSVDSLVFESIALTSDQVYVSANYRDAENRSVLFLFSDHTLRNYELVTIDTHLGPTTPDRVNVGEKYRYHSLRVGDLNADGDQELISSGYRKEMLIGNIDGYTVKYTNYLFVWDESGELQHELLMYEEYFWDEQFQYLTFDVEQENIICYDGYHLILFQFNGTHLEEIWRILPDGGRNVCFASADGDAITDIFLGGAYMRFYLEIFDLQGQRLWYRYKEEQDEGDVIAFCIK